jgi:uncharacterized RDD family membrane protein YckC
MEAAAPSMRYKTVGPRFLAGWVDGLILLPLGFLSEYIFEQGIIWLTVVWIPVFYSAFWLYSVIGHAVYGQTVGKHVTKLMVLDNKTETRIGWRQAILRDSFFILANTLSATLYVYFVAAGVTEIPSGLQIVVLVLNYSGLIWFITEIVTCLSNKKSRALHDFIAGTVVVNTADKPVFESGFHGH